MKILPFALMALSLPAVALPTATVTAFSPVTWIESDGTVQIPHLVYRITGLQTGDTNYNSFTGAASCITTATTNSPAGAYPITCTQSTLASTKYAFAFVPGTLTILPTDVRRAHPRGVIYHPAELGSAIAYAASLGQTLYNDGTHEAENNAAINAILHDQRQSGVDYLQNPRFLYFPAGHYAMGCSAELDVWGNALSLEGDGSSRTFFELPDKCPRMNTGSLTAMFVYDPVEDNSTFLNFVNGIGVNLGRGNHDATFARFNGNNSSSLRNLNIWCGDMDCAEGVNFYLQAGENGPMAVEDVAITGTRACIDNTVKAPFGATYEGITCQAYTTYGIHSDPFHLWMRHIATCGAGTAVSLNNANFALIDSQFLCGSSASTAVIGDAYVRDITSSGFGHTLSAGGTNYDGNIAERWSGTANTLFGIAGPGSNRVPMQETPRPLPPDPAVTPWLHLSADPSLQGTQLATCPVSRTAWVSPGVQYFPKFAGQVGIVVPDCIDYIVRYDSVVERNPGQGKSLQPNYIVNGSSATPLILDRMGSYWTVTHGGPRTVAMIDGIGDGYFTLPGAGNVFFDNVQPQQNQTLYLRPTQKMFGRQFDIEQMYQPHVVCDGAKVSILGLKAELPDTLFTATNGCTADIIGGLIAPVTTCADGVPCTRQFQNLFKVQDSSFFATYFIYTYDPCAIPQNFVSETQHGVTHSIASPGPCSYSVGMYFARPPVAMQASRKLVGKTARVGKTN